jgi:hypothetical protein
VYQSLSGFPSVLTTSKLEISATDFRLGALFGSECSQIMQFSVGAEFSFTYVSFGNPQRTTTVTPPPSTTNRERKQHFGPTYTFLCGGIFFRVLTDCHAPASGPRGEALDSSLI